MVVPSDIRHHSSAHGLTWPLRAFCAVAFIALLGLAFDTWGLGGRPWLGYFDANLSTTNVPYVATLVAVAGDGAAARAGLAQNDSLDMRELDANARASGEAYSPDEVDALAAFAHGVGSALDSIHLIDIASTRHDEVISELRALREAVERLKPDTPTR